MLDASRLRYLVAVATQDNDTWDGIYHPAFAGSNLEYLFQFAFAGYALAAMQQQVPAWRGPDTPIHMALAGIVRRMLDPRVYRYWSAHRQERDPIRRANIMYSGHLSCVLSLAELLGVGNYDQPMRFTLDRAPVGEHDHAGIAGAIHEQMVAAPSHGVACEPGSIYVCCNNHAAISNLLYDQAHPGQDFSAINAEWRAWVRRRMVLAPWHQIFPGPPGGILSAAHRAPRDFSYPVATNFTDAWGLALMTPYDPDLAHELAPRLWRRLRRDQAGRYLPSMGLLTRAEASDAALNTGFAYVLARELGAERIAADLRAWAEARLGPRTEANHTWLAGEHSALYTTALFALGDVITPGGLAALFTVAPRYDPAAPYVTCVPFPVVALTQAEWRANEGVLLIGVAPFTLATLADRPAQVVARNLPSQPHVPLAWESSAAWDATRHELTITLPPGPAQALRLTM